MNMFRLLIALALLFLLIPAGNIHAQAKVGASPAPIMLFSPSARIIGMGEAGVALADGFPSFHNPAALALGNIERRFQFAFLPTVDTRPPSATATEKLGHIGLCARILPLRGGTSDWNLSLGYSRTKWNAWLLEWSYERGVPVEPPHQFNEETVIHSLMAGMAWTSAVDFGIGFSTKFQSSDWNWGSELYAIDAGVLLRVPIRLFRTTTGGQTSSAWFVRPSVGLAFLNDQIGTKWPSLYALPSATRSGLAVTIFKTRSSSILSEKLVSLTTSLEVEHRHGRTRKADRTKLGLEAGFREALYLRVGRMSEGGDTFQTTWGLGVNIQGIARMLGRAKEGSILRFLQEKLMLEYSYASYSDDYAYLNGAKFHQIRMAY